ncbi:MAG: DUF1840 domain-containing protein [Rubrivivax sp.]|jgi:hypothetical protein
MYRFKCKATGDLLMLKPHAERALKVLGREPSAQGIIEVQDMPSVLARLQEAVDDDTRRRAQAAEGGPLAPGAVGADAPASTADELPLRQRWWPLMEMIRQAHAGREPIVWGV